MKDSSDLIFVSSFRQNMNCEKIGILSPAISKIPSFSQYIFCQDKDTEIRLDLSPSSRKKIKKVILKYK